jgi:DNA-binding PadR family transcriptional regulator
MPFLSRIEEILLLTIWKLKDDAYGIAIRRQVEKDTGISWLSEAIYAPLSRLKEKGYVKSIKAESSTKKGGRPRIYYRLTPSGIDRLIAVQKVNRSLWEGVPDLKKAIKNE